MLGDVGDEHSGGHLVRAHTAAVTATVQVFLELAVQVDVVDPCSDDLGAYRLVVVPDGMVVGERTARVLERYRSAGGTVVLSGAACLDGKGRALLDGLPYRYEGPAPTVPCYVRPTGDPTTGGELATDYDYVLYDGAHLVTPLAGAGTSGHLRRAHFDRRWDQFTSHMHAPVGADLASPLVVSGDGYVYFAAPLFSSYGRHEYWVYRQLIAQALAEVLAGRLLQTDAPAWIEASIHTQHSSHVATGTGPTLPGRYVVSLTAYQPRRSTSSVPRVDEGGLTAGITLRLRPQHGFRVHEVTLEPGGAAVPARWSGDLLVMELPPIPTHCAVVVHGLSDDEQSR